MHCRYHCGRARELPRPGCCGSTGVQLSWSAAYRLGQDPVALCSCGCRVRQADVLKEGDDVLLPKDPLVLLLQVDEWIGGLGVPNVGFACLHSQAQVVADDLNEAST